MALHVAKPLTMLTSLSLQQTSTRCKTCSDPQPAHILFIFSCDTIQVYFLPVTKIFLLLTWWVSMGTWPNAGFRSMLLKRVVLLSFKLSVRSEPGRKNCKSSDKASFCCVVEWRKPNTPCYCRVSSSGLTVCKSWSLKSLACRFWWYWWITWVCLNLWKSFWLFGGEHCCPKRNRGEVQLFRPSSRLAQTQIL